MLDVPRARARKFWHFCNQILHFTASMGHFPLYSVLNFPVLQSLFGLVFILHFGEILFYILQAHLFYNFTARTLVIFHSTFSKKASLRLYVLHINPPPNSRATHHMWCRALYYKRHTESDEYEPCIRPGGLKKIDGYLTKTPSPKKYNLTMLWAHLPVRWPIIHV